ncbi:MAG: DUF2116 family Zn-ribbon domain-containing protein [Bacteroidetes bacterium]|jgi:predicted nucleic acid-binding Zn ribbon protein|nr:DUF2116 family Zn-ribbon domain-containing protein [Bacteroidota bacterium]PHX82913.1 MAG: hypothetical protein CK539_02250 [Flavobacteriales bacterium]
MERKCIDCGDSINGRADKKFCSDQCRNSYNNRLNSTDTNFMRNVNNILRKNRRILGTLTPNGKSSIHKDKILDLGFNFSYFTHTYTTRKGAVYFFCYEFGYLAIGNDFLSLVHRKKTENS